MFLSNVPYHHKGDFCPACKSNDKKPMKHVGRLRLIKGKYGDFLGCSEYPACQYTQKLYKSGT